MNEQEKKMLECQIIPRSLSFSLDDYHKAITEGPLHYTWIDKPHRLVYDLIAAVKYYAIKANEIGMKFAQTEQEPMTRYCPECSHIGDVPTTAIDCCPDGNHARIVPQRFAELCRDTFKRSIDKSSQSKPRYVLMITVAYEQGVGKGHQAFLRKRKIDNPYVEGDCFDAWQYGYREGTKQAKDIEAKT